MSDIGRQQRPRSACKCVGCIRPFIVHNVITGYSRCCICMQRRSGLGSILSGGLHIDRKLHKSVEASVWFDAGHAG